MNKSACGLLLSGLALLVSLHGAEAPRTAVLDFVRTDSPGSLDTPTTDFSRAVQAQLLASNDYAWVERQEFDRITRETDLAGLSRSDALSAVRLGHLLRADLLLRGQIAPKTTGQGELTLEVIDLKHAEVLASRTVPIGMSASQRLRPSKSDVAAASLAALTVLEAARGSLEQMRTEKVIAALYIRNISRTERAGFIEAKVKEAIAAAATPATGVRMLRFPRAGEAGEESSLVLAGLTDTDPEAWQHVADTYVWGTISEQGADGVEFSEAPVTISLQVMSGAGEAREVRWEGAVKNLEIGLQSVAAGVLEVAKAGAKTTGGTTERKQIAEALRKRADEVWQAISKERNQPRPGAVSSIDYLLTTPGRQSFAYRLKLLEAACFFDPLNRSLQETRLEAAWRWNPAGPTATLQGHWLRMADYEAQARRFERKADGSLDLSWTKQRANQLLDLVKALEHSLWNTQSRGHASPEDIQRQRRAVFARWGAVVEAANQPAGAGKAEVATEEDNQGWMEDLFYLTENSGDYVTARQVVDQTWPVLKKAAGRLLKSSGDEQHKQNFIDQMYSIYDAFGEFDQAAAMLDEAWKAGTAPLPVLAVKPPPPRRTDKPWQPVKQFQFMPPPGAAGPEMTKLEVSVREIDLWPTMANYRFDPNGAGLERMRGRVIDALAWQGGRLWVAESGQSLPPEEGTPNPQGNAYLWRYDPALHTSEYVSAKLGAHSQVRELLPVGDELWLALDADGVWQRSNDSVKRYKAEDGLMSPRMIAAQAGRTELFFLGGTPPNYSISRYSTTTGKWFGMQAPAPTGPPVPPPIPGMLPMGPGANPPQLAVCGEWICAGTPAVSFYNLTTNTWTNLLAQVPAGAFSSAQPAGPQLPPDVAKRLGIPASGPQLASMPVSFPLVSADEKGFWLGAPGGLLFVNPQAPAEAKQIALPGLPLVAAHHGPWLWLVMNENFGLPKLVLIDKRTATITGMAPLPAGFMRKMVATDTRVWIGGSTLIEVILREPRAAEGTAKEVLSDHSLVRVVWQGDLAQVKAALATKPKLDEPTTSGWTALMVAAEAGRADLVEELLKAGANPNLSTQSGRTPLHLSLEADNPVLVELLLQHAADTNRRGPVRIRGLQGLRPLAEEMTLPPENKAIPSPPTGLKATVNADGEVVLTWQEHAASDARYHVTRNSAVIADLSAGVARFVDANPPWGEAKGRYGVGAWNAWGHWEFRENEVPEVVVALPARPADVVQLPQGFGFGGGPVSLPLWAMARPVLVEASAAGRTEAVKAMLAHGADANITDGTGQTALIAAIRAVKYGTARQLLAAGAKAGMMTQAAESAASLAYKRHDDEGFFREIMAALPPTVRIQEASSLIIEAAGNGQIKDIELLRSLGGDLGGLTESGESALSLAIQRDQTETALWLLEQKVPLHRKIRGPLGPFETDKPVLKAAVRTNRPEIITRLLEAGCDSNLEIDGKPLVVLAAQLKSFETLRLLQEHGADLKQKDSEGKTLANYLSPEEVRLFLPAEASTANWPPPRGKSFRQARWTQPAAAADTSKLPLIEQLVVACKAGDLAGAKAAVQAGAQIDQQSEDGRTALHHALLAQHPEVARWLIEEGASVNVTSRGGNTPLNFAIQNGEQLAMVDYLLAAGADPNAFGSIDGTTGYPAVYSAVVTGNRPALKRLLQTEAAVNLHGYNDQRVLVSPLAMALAKGDEESVNVLLAARANPRAQTWSFMQTERGTQKDRGPTLLMYAASGGKVALLQQMISLGQNPRFKAAEGYDALAWAAGAGKKEAVEFLLPLSEPKGRALENALRYSRAEIITILQRAGYQSP